MHMQSRVEEATKRHQSGYNCCQAVACAYCELLGVDEGTVFKTAEGLGLGMGGMEGTCGAVSGACLLAGLKVSSGDPQNPTTKGASQKLSREITAKFMEKTGTLTCKELKGVGTGKPVLSCPECVRLAAQIAEEVLFD